MKKLITLLLFGWLACYTAVGQVTFSVSPQSTSADQGQNIDIDITTNDFTNIISMQLRMNWDNTILELTSITAQNLPAYNYTPDPNDVDNFGPVNATVNSLVTSWISGGFTPVSLNPNDVIFTMHFSVVGNPGTSTDITFDNEEVIDGNFSQVSTILNNGTFTVNGTPPPTGDLTVSVGSVSDSTGKAICVPVTVDNFDLIEGLQHSINFDETVLSFDSIGAINLIDLTTGNFGVANASNGDITLSWQDLTTGNGVSVSDGTEIYKLYFTIIGAGGTTSDISISGTPLSIEVTQGGNPNAPLISNNGTVTVLGNSGPINGVSFIASDETGDNGAQVCVDVTVNNFTDIVSAQYAMEFDETIMTFAGIQFVNGNPLGLSFDPSNPGAGNFGVSNAASGLLSFSWLNAAGSTLASNTSIYEVCFDIIGSAGQVSPFDFTGNGTPIEVTNTSSSIVNFNEVNGSVTVTGTFNGLNLGFGCADANPGDNICVDVNIVDGFTDIVSIQYGMSWDPTVLSFDTILLNPNPLGLTYNPNPQAISSFGTLNVGSGTASFSWLDGSLSGVTLQNGVSLYQLCFDVIGGVGSSSDFTFTEPPTIEVSDGNGTIINFLGNPCTVNIVLNNPLAITNADITNIDCFGESTGAIDITVEGGATPYSFDWDPNNATTEDISALGAGTYTVTVTDGNLETVTGTYSVTQPSSAVSVTGSASGETSPGAGGAIDITPDGGTSPYTYLWSNNMTSQDLANLAAGTYTVTVTDDKNCEAIESFTVNPFNCPTINVTGSVTDETSVGAGGAIDITVTGGTGTYTFDWNNGQFSTEDLSNLAAGTYTVVATDGNNCTGTATFTVNPFNCPAITITGTVNHETIVGGDGSVDISVSGGTTPYNYNWNNGQFTTEDISNLVAGVYSVVVTDASGCTGTAEFTVDGFNCPTITVDFNTTNVSCRNGNDGSIIASANGGTAPYEYFWAPINVSGESIANVVAGTYTVLVTDANLCEVTVTTIVTEPDEISINTTVVNDISCAGEDDGSITITTSGGTAPLNVNWGSGLTGTSITNLPAGDYTPTITDMNGCEMIGSTSTITEPSAISATPTITDVTCNNGDDGSITLVVTGGTAPHTVTWAPGVTGLTISNLSPGTISPTITDANGCSISEIYTIGNPEAISISQDVTNETSAGNDGAIDVTVSPNGNYTYVWTNSNGVVISGNEDLNNLVADIYTLEVTNAVGCTETAIIPVTNSLGLQSVIVTDVLCNGGSTGAIDITPSGGTAPYTYLWNNGQFTTQDLNNIPAGNYDLTITDDAGIQFTDSYTVNQPTSISITPTVQHETVSNDGSISLAVSGGTPQYTYVWSNGATSQNISNLSAGTYTPTVTDANGCVATTGTITINPAMLSIPAGNISVTNVSCNGGNDGSITIIIVGGGPGYDVVLTDPNGGTTVQSSSTSNTYTYSGLGNGNHFITATDLLTSNSVTIGPITIEEPTVLEETTVTLQNASGPGIADGAIYVSLAGGTPIYTYLWNNGATSEDLIGIVAGIYELTVTDANGCTLVSGPHTVTNDMVTEISPIHVSCNGDSDASIDLEVSGGLSPYTYIWTDDSGVQFSTDQDVSNLAAGTYTVMIFNANGVLDQEITQVITEPDPIVITPNTTAPTPGVPGKIELAISGGTSPYTYLWKDAIGNDLSTNKDLLNLTGGEYFVTVTDFNGCTSDASFILPGAELPVDLVVLNDPSCEDDCNGILEVKANLGTLPYNYVWNTGATSSRITDLCAGEYSVTVSDNSGFSNELSFTLVNPDPIQITLSTSPGHVEAVVIGGTPDYLYQWDDEVTSDSFIDGVRGGLHMLQVTDANGCISEIVSVQVPYNTDCLRSRSVMSPNDDGKNDVFYINCIEDFESHLAVYNRWGQLVFEADNYDNSWKATGAKGQTLPEGGYFFVLDYTDANGASQQEKGSITIIRN